MNTFPPDKNGTELHIFRHQLTISQHALHMQMPERMSSHSLPSYILKH